MKPPATSNGRPTAAQGRAAQGTPFEVVYGHDAFDRRVTRLDATTGQQQRYVYGDGLRIVGELDERGGLAQRYVYGLRGHVPAYLERGQQRIALITDVRGSVRLAVDVDSGAVLQRIAYGPFGAEVSRGGVEPWLTPLGYAGGLTDAATGLVRFGARDYDAYTGRWTAMDPIGFAGGDVNLYGYVVNDPVNRVDPSGLDWDDAVEAFWDYAPLALVPPAWWVLSAPSGCSRDEIDKFLSGELDPPEEKLDENTVITPGGRVVGDHAQESLFRHNYPDYASVDAVIDNADHVTSQRGGGTVYVVDEGDGLWSWVVWHNSQIVTGWHLGDSEDIESQARNYGWGIQRWR